MNFDIVKTEPEHVIEIKEIEISSNLSPWTIADYLREITRPDSIFLAAKNGSNIIGFLVARLIMYYPNNQPHQEMEIYNIAVEKGFRRHSIASNLLNKAIASLNDDCIQKISLEVRKSNISAQNFYLKHSFEIIGERKNFYSNPPEDAILMCRFMNFI